LGAENPLFLKIPQGRLKLFRLRQGLLEGVDAEVGPSPSSYEIATHKSQYEMVKKRVR
jgi:hypothetical protein